jgi:hypothetical protein
MWRITADTEVLCVSRHRVMGLLKMLNLNIQIRFSMPNMYIHIRHFYRFEIADYVYIFGIFNMTLTEIHDGTTRAFFIQK